MTRRDTSGPTTKPDERAERGGSADQLFRVLGHHARRRVLTALSDEDPSEGKDGDAVAFTPQRLGLGLYWTELYHWHLPKLSEAGFIDWDPATNTIKRGPRFDEIQPMLERLDSHQKRLTDTWP